MMAELLVLLYLLQERIWLFRKLSRNLCISNKISELWLHRISNTAKKTALKREHASGTPHRNQHSVVTAEQQAWRLKFSLVFQISLSFFNQTISTTTRLPINLPKHGQNIGLRCWVLRKCNLEKRLDERRNNGKNLAIYRSG